MYLKKTGIIKANGKYNPAEYTTICPIYDGAIYLFYAIKIVKYKSFY